MMAVCVFVALSALLFVGKIVRMKLTFLQRLYLPSSVVGGLIGLAIVSVFGGRIPEEGVMVAQKVPGFLINVVFATLFLGAATPKLRDVVKFAMPQLCLGQMIAWGQYVVGLGLAGFVFVRLFGVPAAFGNLLEIGFEGGHGTVGGMIESFRTFGWEDGIALGYTMATAGMILGIVLGMVMIQWAYRRRIVTQVVAFGDRRLHTLLWHISIRSKTVGASFHKERGGDDQDQHDRADDQERGRYAEGLEQTGRDRGDDNGRNAVRGRCQTAGKAFFVREEPDSSGDRRAIDHSDAKAGQNTVGDDQGRQIRSESRQDHAKTEQGAADQNNFSRTKLSI